MIRCASGSIQVVTKVARLRCGSPSSASSSSTRRIASTAVMPVSGSLVARHLLGEEAVAEQGGSSVPVGDGRSCASPSGGGLEVFGAGVFGAGGVRR